MRSYELLNMLFICLPFGAAFAAVYLKGCTETEQFRMMILLPLLFCLIYGRFVRIYEGFAFSAGRIHELVLGQMMSAIMANIIVYGILWLVNLPLPGLLPLAAVLAVQVMIICVWTVTVHKWYIKTTPMITALLVYSGESRGERRIEEEYGYRARYHTLKSISLNALAQENYASVRNAEVVFLEKHGATDDYVSLMKRCAGENKTLFVLPDTEDYFLHGAKSIHMFHRNLLCIRKYHPSASYLITKRVIDIALSLAALVLLSPLMLFTAAAIKLCDGGPVFYMQSRLTQGGKQFQILKFRSMCMDAEKDGVARLSVGAKDERITSIGRIIRKYRVDELPQFINILKGEMSIVGPRPERPELTEEYEKLYPDFRLRLQVKAGLTGYAQVYGRYNTPPEEKLGMDLAYIESLSIFQDFIIMLVTLKILFVPESTEGMNEGQKNAV